MRLTLHMPAHYKLVTVMQITVFVMQITMFAHRVPSY